MKVCIRGYDIYPNEKISPTKQSGLVKYTQQLMKRWLHEGLDISFIRSGSKEMTRHPVVVDDVRVYAINTTIPKETTEKKQRYFIDELTEFQSAVYRDRARQLAEIVKVEQPEILHLHNARPAIEYIYASHEDLMPSLHTVLTIHDIDDPSMHMIAKYHDYFDRIVAISTSVKERILVYDIPEEKVVLLTSGMEIEEYDNLIEETLESPIFDKWKKWLVEKKETHGFDSVILMPARRVPHKGHYDAIEAIAKLKKKGMNVALLISGAEMNTTSVAVQRYEKELKNHIHTEELENLVFLLHSLSDKELCVFYHLSDAVLTPSTEPEGFCFANLEAMLCRTVVVTSRTGGPLDYIEDERTGFFVEPGNVDDIVRVIQKVIRQSDLTSVQDHAQEVAHTFSCLGLAKSYLRLFNELSSL